MSALDTTPTNRQDLEDPLQEHVLEEPKALVPEVLEVAEAPVSHHSRLFNTRCSDRLLRRASLSSRILVPPVVWRRFRRAHNLALALALAIMSPHGTRDSKVKDLQGSEGT